MKLQFLQEVVPLPENENKKEALKNQLRITEEEHLKCRKVADAFAELYSIDLLVLVAGIYGFVKLQYYHHPFGYDYTDIFICGTDLFDNLWNEWLSTQLLSLAKGTPMADLNHQDIFQCLPAEKQNVQLCASSLLKRTRNYHPLDPAHGGQARKIEPAFPSTDSITSIHKIYFLFLKF